MKKSSKSKSHLSISQAEENTSQEEDEASDDRTTFKGISSSAFALLANKPKESPFEVRGFTINESFNYECLQGDLKDNRGMTTDVAFSANMVVKYINKDSELFSNLIVGDQILEVCGLPPYEKNFSKPPLELKLIRVNGMEPPRQTDPQNYTEPLTELRLAKLRTDKFYYFSAALLHCDLPYVLMRYERSRKKARVTRVARFSKPSYSLMPGDCIIEVDGKPPLRSFTEHSGRQKKTGSSETHRILVERSIELRSTPNAAIINNYKISKPTKGGAQLGGGSVYLEPQKVNEENGKDVLEIALREAYRHIETLGQAKLKQELKSIELPTNPLQQPTRQNSSPVPSRLKSRSKFLTKKNSVEDDVKTAEDHKFSANQRKSDELTRNEPIQVSRCMSPVRKSDELTRKDSCRMSLMSPTKKSDELITKKSSKLMLSSELDVKTDVGGSRLSKIKRQSKPEKSVQIEPANSTSTIPSDVTADLQKVTKGSGLVRYVSGIFGIGKQ